MCLFLHIHLWINIFWNPSAHTTINTHFIRYRYFKASLLYSGILCVFLSILVHFFFLQHLYKTCQSTSFRKTFSSPQVASQIDWCLPYLWFQSPGPGQIKQNSFFPKRTFLEPHKGAEHEVETALTTQATVRKKTKTFLNYKLKIYTYIQERGCYGSAKYSWHWRLEVFAKPILEFIKYTRISPNPEYDRWQCIILMCSHLPHVSVWGNIIFNWWHLLILGMQVNQERVVETEG